MKKNMYRFLRSRVLVGLSLGLFIGLGINQMSALTNLPPITSSGALLTSENWNKMVTALTDLTIINNDGSDNLTISGGTLSVPEPSADEHAATKAYVDQQVVSAGGSLNVYDPNAALVGKFLSMGSGSIFYAKTSNDIATEAKIVPQFTNHHILYTELNCTGNAYFHGMGTLTTPYYVYAKDICDAYSISDNYGSAAIKSIYYKATGCAALATTANTTSYDRGTPVLGCSEYEVR